MRRQGGGFSIAGGNGRHRRGGSLCGCLWSGLTRDVAASLRRAPGRASLTCRCLFFFCFLYGWRPAACTLTHPTFVLRCLPPFLLVQVVVHFHHGSGAVGTEAVSSTYAAMSVRYAALAVFLSVDVTTASELAAAVAVSTTGTTPTFVFHLATRPVHRFEGPDMEQLAAVLAQFASAVAAGAGNGGSAMGAGGGPGGPGMGGGGGGRPSKEERMAAVKANAVTFVTAVAMVRALPLLLDYGYAFFHRDS